MIALPDTPLTPDEFRRADVNEDGDVTLADFGEWLRLYRKHKRGEIEDPNKPLKEVRKVDKESGFTLVAQFFKNGIWEYTVSGELPSPCYSAEFDVKATGDGTPVTYFVSVVILNPRPEQQCILKTEPFTGSGNFRGSVDAIIDFSVNYVTPVGIN